ncbi:lysylphosphatidylglycerol synthase transmembrane domain-containing protein [Candidatus Uabimicrobium amorphum]|uniref:Flippase-like domain-containing protein n=1 Tax=Uabimicrobium amorphum TaxID=2596890 RepID=A0A5S9IPA8_UABAM|nr:lysylphosphatidylglycerol synthase transmembrane domain-containing protein [Candidatus Uabimicrobium amorphum]BBM84971.1 hypothetical protein UABAM_03334 [Candidatus Uabimicrobium amorphum]
MRKHLSFLLRFSITLAILLYLVNYMIVFHDTIHLADGGVIPCSIQQITDSVHIINAQNTELKIPLSHIDPKKGIEYGFYSIIRNLNIAMYLAFTLFIVCNIFLTSWRIILLLQPQNINITFWQMSKINFVSTFFGNFLPGFTGGDALKIYYLARKSSQVLKPIAIVLFDRVIGLMALIFVATLVTSLQIHIAAIQHVAPFIFILFLGAITGILMLFFLPLSFIQNRHYLLDQIIDIVIITRKNPFIFAKTIFISVVVHSLTNIWVYGFATALGINLPIYIFFVFVPISFIIIMLPISLAGWGVGEATYSYLFSTVGVPKTKAVTLSVLTKFGKMLVGTIGALIWVSDKDIRRKE